MFANTSNACWSLLLRRVEHDMTNNLVSTLHAPFLQTLQYLVTSLLRFAIVKKVVEELVQRIVVLEDIAADAAVQICMHFSILQVKNPI